MVVFPQPPEFSTGRPQSAKNRLQVFAQEISQVQPHRIAYIHTSTTPYYD